MLIPTVLLPLSILPFILSPLLFVFVLPPSVCYVSIRATGAIGWRGHFTLQPGSVEGYSAIHTILVRLNYIILKTQKIIDHKNLT